MKVSCDIFSVVTSLVGPRHFYIRSIECVNGINASNFPWRNIVGHVTYSILFILLNLYLTKAAANFPAKYYTTSFNEVNGDININAPTLYILAIWIAGPLPIERPNNIIF